MVSVIFTHFSFYLRKMFKYSTAITKTVNDISNIEGTKQKYTDQLNIINYVPYCNTDLELITIRSGNCEELYLMTTASLTSISC